MSELLRKNNPIIWCSGCVLYSILNQVIKNIEKEGLKEPVCVSGIGCAARSSGYFNFDSVNALHGRAIPIAEGIKRGNDDLNVFVLSGDGDLLAIGLNHLIHCSRRNTDITIFCADNQIYGLTGGQASPTSQKGEITKSSPYGAEFEPINIQKILMSNKNYFYARTNAYNTEHLLYCIKESFKHKGFSFVDVKMACLTEWIDKGKVKKILEIKDNFQKNYDYVEEIRELNDNEYGINKK